MPASANDKQVFDVAKPGKTAASATSRPVIVNHGPMLKDPMVSDQPAADQAKLTDPKSSPSPVPSESRKVIAPISDDNSVAKKSSGQDNAVDKSDDQASQQSETDESAPSTSSTQASPAENAPASPKEDSSAIVDAVVDQTMAKKKNEPTKEEVARIAELEKIVESKQYYVTLKTNKTKRKTNSLVALVLFLVILAGVYLAIDAGLIDLNINLPVNLITN